MKYIESTRKIIDPFTYYLPTLDVHGFDRDYTILKLREFIEDNLKLGKYHIVIVHGKGTGILKNTIHNYLKKDKRVIEYRINISNLGQTEIFLKRD